MSKPNLLFLITDQQRAETVTADSPCHMPHLAEIASFGTQFERCYAPNPICSPTRASLMTGLLPHSHGMVDVTHAVDTYRASLKPGLPFWSQTLQQAGYHTGYFGKWHVERSNKLENFGFDQYDVEQYHQLQGLVQREEHLHPNGTVRQRGYRDFPLYGVTDAPVESTAEYQLYSRGIEFVQAGARQPNQPWALFLSTEAPHDPYIVPRPYYQRYSPADIPRPASFKDKLSRRPAIYRRIQQVWQHLGWAQFAEASACYYALCSLIDDQIGRLLDVLKQTNQFRDTIIVFTSDHGDYLGAHRLMLKGIPAFEEAYRVPLIIEGPGIPTGRQIDSIVSLLDLAPTLVPLTTGGEFSGHGRSLLPLFQPDDQPNGKWRNEAFAECHGQRFNYTQRILWLDNFKYVFNGFDNDELYDLDSDPHELNNLAGNSTYHGVLDRMAARMWDIIRDTDDKNMLEAQYGMFRFAPVGPEKHR